MQINFRVQILSKDGYASDSDSHKPATNNDNVVSEIDVSEFCIIDFITVCARQSTPIRIVDGIHIDEPKAAKAKAHA